MRNVFKSGLLFLIIGICFIVLSILPFIHFIILAKSSPDPSAISMGIGFMPPAFLVCGLVLSIIGINRLVKKRKFNRK
jgi:hypothetical protein